MGIFMGRLFVPFFYQKATFNETVFVFILEGKKNYILSSDVKWTLFPNRL